MAIVKVNFSNIRNTATGKTSVPIGGESSHSRGDKKQKGFGVYTKDSERENMKTFVGTSNPLYEAFKESDGIISDQSEHVYEFINKYKICDITWGSLGGYPLLSLNSDRWGNWRDPNINPAKISVSPFVFLFPSEKSFSFSYNNEYGKAWDKLSSSGMLSKVQQAAEAMRAIAALVDPGSIEAAGKFVPRFKEAPTWDGTKPLTLNSSLKFEFKFGQAGIFSGEEEVVRPILALASLFAPLGGAYLKGPAPTPPAMLMELLTGIPSTLKNLGEVITGEGGIISKVTNIEKQLVEHQNSAIERGLAKYSRGLYVRMGRMSWGPALVKDVNWDFNFEQVDEYGFPYQGSITFGGLESPVVPRPEEFTTIFNGTNASTSNDFREADNSKGDDRFS